MNKAIEDVSIKPLRQKKNQITGSQKPDKFLRWVKDTFFFTV